MKSSIIIVIGVCLLSSPLPAQEVEYVGSTLWRYIRCVDVVDDYAYCVFGNGLAILDVADPDSALMVGSLYLPGYNSWIDVCGDYAYLANTFGLQIMDIADRNNPVQIGSYETDDGAYHVLVSGMYAYLKGVDSVNTIFEFIDISEPSNPRFTGSYTVPGNFINIFVLNDRAYIAAGRLGLQVLDISDPANPERLGVFTSDYSFWKVFVHGEYAYTTATTSDGPPYGAVIIIDVSDPDNMYQTCIERAYDPFGDIIVENEYLFVQYSEDGRVVIFDLSDPSCLEYVSFYMTYDFASYGFAVVDDCIYIPEPTSGLEMVDISEPDDPVLSGFYRTPGYPWHTVVSDGYAYTAVWEYGLHIHDISDPHNPVRIGGYDIETLFVSRVFLFEDYAYVASGYAGLQILNVANPAAPQYVGSYENVHCRDVSVSGNYAYTISSSESSEFQVLDISDPSNPALIGNCDFPDQHANSVFLDENIVYLTVQDSIPGLWVIDVSDPVAPVVLGNHNTTGAARKVFINDDYAYLGCRSLLIFDISDPYNLNLIGGYDTGLVFDVFVADNYAYAAISRFGLKIIDVSDPSDPLLAASYNTSCSAFGIFVSAEYIYLTTEYSFLILNFDPQTGIIEEVDRIPSSFALAPNYPNPFNASTTISYELPVVSDVRLEIYDILGRKVETLIEGPQPAGAHSIVWDAEDVSSGIYFYRIQAGDFHESRSCLLLK